jgi:hypothetical protein
MSCDRYDGAQPLNDLWELELREVLHDSEAAALDYLPVDAGTGAPVPTGLYLRLVQETRTHAQAPLLFINRGGAS